MTDVGCIEQNQSCCIGRNEKDNLHEVSKDARGLSNTVTLPNPNKQTFDQTMLRLYIEIILIHVDSIYQDPLRQWLWLHM